MNAQRETKFTVSVTDTCTAQKVQVEVSEAIYQVLTVETRRRFWREESRDRRHIDNFNGLHQYIEIDHPNTAGETLEAIFTRRETTRQCGLADVQMAVPGVIAQKNMMRVSKVRCRDTLEILATCRVRHASCKSRRLVFR